MLGERLAQYSPLPAMHGLVDGIVGIVYTLDGRERVVEFRFLQSLPVSIDIVQPPIRVDRDEVWCDPNMSSILSVLLV